MASTHCRRPYPAWQRYADGSVGSVKVAQIFQDLPSEAQHLGHWLHLFSFKPWRIPMERQRGHAFSRQKSEIRMIRKGMVHWKFQFTFILATSDAGTNQAVALLCPGFGGWSTKKKGIDKMKNEEQTKYAYYIYIILYIIIYIIINYYLLLLIITYYYLLLLIIIYYYYIL